MIFKHHVYIFLLAAICCTILLTGCNNNPCKDIKCSDICHGDELWSQTCDGGKCIDYKRMDNCSVTCGCNPKELVISQEEDLCSQIICDNICQGDQLWSSKCVDGQCIKDKVLQKCSSKCGCDPYIFSELPYPDTTYILSNALAQVYNFKDGDLIRIVLTCKKASCYDSPRVYYIFAGNRDLTELVDDKFILIENPNEWKIKNSGNYLIAVSNEYYMKIGYLYEK